MLPRLALLAAGILLAGCNVPMDDREHLSSVGIERGSDGSSGIDTFTVRVTLPEGMKVVERDRPAELLDEAGNRYRMTRTQFTEGSDTPTEIAATFEVPTSARPTRLLVGEYDIDFVNSRVHPRGVKRGVS